MPPKVRRQGSAANRVARVTIPLVGEKPADVVEHYSKLDVKRKHALYEGLVGPTRILCSGFLENLDKNRVPVPIHENHRVKATSNKRGDVEYVPATYAKLERDDYVIWQAPTKENMAAFWRKVWQDGVQIIVCMSETFSATDPTKCYPYWPTNEKEPLNLQNGRYVIKLEKKHIEDKCKEMLVYELMFTSTDPGDMPTEGPPSVGASSDDEDGSSDNGKHSVALYHYHSWPEGTWPNSESLASFFQSIAKREVQIMRKSKCDLLPPVVIQGYSGLGRATVAWVGAILGKDVEKKDCFDIPDLIHRCIKLRPGAFCNKLYYFVSFAVGFRQAQLTTWSEGDIDKWTAEIEAAYKQYK